MGYCSILLRRPSTVQTPSMRRPSGSSKLCHQPLVSKSRFQFRTYSKVALAIDLQHTELLRAVNKPRKTIHRKAAPFHRKAPGLFSAILRRVAVFFEQLQQRPMGGEFVDERGEQPLDFESGRLHGLTQLMRGVLANVTDLSRVIGLGASVQEKNLRVVVAVERLGDAGNAARVWRGHEKSAA